MVKFMKGRTACPKCKHEFVLDVPDGVEKYETQCPNCSNKFTIKVKPKTDEKGECFWEEHGEPRKTILSSIKPKSNKPTIAAIILVVVFSLGIATSIFSGIFIDSSMGVASSMGIKGSITIDVVNQTNISLEGAQIIVGNNTGFTDSNGSYSVSDISPGVTNVNISYQGDQTINREILVLPWINSHHEIKIEPGDNKTIKFDTLGCSIIFAIFATFALLAAITTLKRQNLDVAVAGSIIGIFSFGFFMIGSILSIIAFILILLSREEFENGKKGKTF